MYKEVQQFLGQSWTDFQRCFAESLQTDIPLLEKVNRFILEHGGKKLRPTFSLLIPKSQEPPLDKHFISSSSPSEKNHTATLLHDDVADDALTRRGVPTVMALYSPSTAVLIGDFWLSRAMDLIIDHPDKRVLHAFSKCLCDLARGEMLQLERAEKGNTSEADYRQIIYCKTTSLFEASIISAAYSAGAGATETEAFRSYALHIGQAFQMMDDILDYSPELSIGKPTGQDIMERKITLPLLCLFRKAPASVVRSLRRRMRKPDAVLVEDIFSLVRQYDALTEARRVLEEEISQAVDALAPVPASEAKNYLIKLAGLMAVRTA